MSRRLDNKTLDGKIPIDESLDEQSQVYIRKQKYMRSAPPDRLTNKETTLLRRFIYEKLMTSSDG